MRECYFTCTCGAWSWARRPTCTSCGKAAPAWVRKLQQRQASRAASTAANKEPEAGAGTKSTGRKKSRKRSRAPKKEKQQEQEQEQAAGTAGSSAAGMQIDDGEVSGLSDVKARIKAVTEAQKQFEQGPVREALDEELLSLREKLHSATPAADRLRALQAGVERRQEKLQKAQNKLSSLLEEQGGLEAALEKEVEQLREKYAARRREIEQALEETRAVIEAAAGEMAEFKETQGQLLANKDQQSKAKMAGFMAICNSLSKAQPCLTDDLWRIHDAALALLEVDVPTDLLPDVEAKKPVNAAQQGLFVPVDPAEAALAARKAHEEFQRAQAGKEVSQMPPTSAAQKVPDASGYVEQVPTRERSTSRSPRGHSG